MQMMRENDSIQPRTTVKLLVTETWIIERETQLLQHSDTRCAKLNSSVNGHCVCSISHLCSFVNDAKNRDKRMQHHDLMIAISNIPTMEIH